MNKRKDRINFSDFLLTEEFQQFVDGENMENADELEEMLANNPDLRAEYDKALQAHSILRTSKKPTFSKSLKDNILQNILDEIKHTGRASSKRTTLIQQPFFRIAASIVLIIGLSFIFGKLFFQKSADTMQMAYNEIIVPSGEKTQVILPDGTHIGLNSESKLRYPSQFKINMRDVYLVGEAYFDVSKINKSKFYVHTQGVNIEVLGTKFNVKSYPDEETVETSVLEGKVKVESELKIRNLEPVYLLPRDKAVFHKKMAKMLSTSEKEPSAVPAPMKTQPLVTVNNVNIKNIICWKDQLLVFDNETLEEIGVKMSRWYKIQVQIPDAELKTQRFTGKFVNNETFYQVMEAINLTTPIQYKFEKDQLTIHARVSGKQKK